MVEKNKTGKSEQEPETLGPPVGAAESTAAQRSKVATPVAVGGDPFVDRVLPHLRKIIVAAVVAGVVIGAFVVWNWWKESKAADATDKLATALDVLRRDVAPEPAADAPKDPAAPAAPKPAAPEASGKTFPTSAARAAAAVAALDQVELEAPRLLAANLALQAGKLDEAQAAYKSAATGSSLEALIAREGLGHVAEARAAAAKDPASRQAALEAALAAFRAVQADDKGPRRDVALYHEARILMLLDQRAEARAALDKALVVAPTSSLEIDIQQRIAQLEATAAP